MKKYNKPIGLEDCDKPMDWKGRIIMSLILGSPIILYGIINISGYYQNKNQKPSYKPSITYDYKLREPDINYREYTPKKEEYFNDPDGVILQIGDSRIYTGLSSEDILQQLSLDYQDLYDYYGGAEELY